MTVENQPVPNSGKPEVQIIAQKSDKGSYWLYFLLAIDVIAIDQTSKLLVHKFMYIHQEIGLATYGEAGQYGFKLHYLLNPGMAFGIRWDNEFGKLLLTFFRIIAMFAISFYMVIMARRGAANGFLVALALILGGAVGNVIDSIFYGVVLHNELPGSVTPWFHGQVIDMLFFPLFEFHWPSWVPGVAGDSFLFFSPVFNIADSSIFIGVTMILIFQKRYFGQRTSGEKTNQSAVIVTDVPTEQSPPAEAASDPQTNG